MTSNLLPDVHIKIYHDLQDYVATFEAMQQFTEQRDALSPDQIWVLQHPALLTLGQAAKLEHILVPSDIPVVRTDRGGQVTWHGPGQLVVYFLLDLNRLNWHVRTLVDFAEHMMLWLLDQYGVVAYSRKDAPGIYVDGCKIGSLGFKIRRGRSYHGLSLNIDCDLSGFSTINPCGYADLTMLRLCDVVQPCPDFSQLSSLIVQYIQQHQVFNAIEIKQY